MKYISLDYLVEVPDHMSEYAVAESLMEWANINGFLVVGITSKLKELDDEQEAEWKEEAKGLLDRPGGITLF